MITNNLNAFTRVLVMLLLVVTIHNVRAYNYSISTYSVNDGLAQSTVYSICNDQRGFVWISTYGGGACKFDGVSFRTITEQDGLGSNQIYKIFEDSHGNLWYGSRGGLTRYDGYEYRTFTTREGLGSNLVKDIIEDKNGTIWVGTFGGGISKIVDDKVVTYDVSDGLISNLVYSLMFDEQGVLWVGTKQGLCFFDGKQFHFIKDPRNEDITIRTITWGLNGKLLFGSTTKGVLKLNKDLRYEEDTTFSGINNISCLLVDKQLKEYWVGTLNNGVYLLKDGITTHYNTFNSQLPNDVVLGMMKDKAGVLWVGTFGGGVAKFSRTPMYAYSMERWISNASVRTINMGPNGNLLFGTRSRGIRTMNFSDEYDFLDKKTIIRIFQARNGDYWYCTDGDGAYRVDSENNITHFTTESGLSSNKVFCVEEDNSGRIWLGTYDNGVTRIGPEDEDIVIFNTATGLGYDQIYDLQFDKKSTMWVATNGGGVSLIKEGEIEILTIENGLSSNDIWTLKQDIFGNIWLGTNGGGLMMFNGRNFSVFSMDQGLNSNNIHSLLFDEANNLWIGSEKGIDKVIFEISDSLNSIQYKIFDIRHYGYNEGLSTVETNHNANYMEEDGTIWFGMVNGVVKYNPKLDIFNKQPPQLHIEKLQLAFEDMDWSEKYDSLLRWSKLPKNLNLRYFQNHLTFYYSAVSTSYSDNLKYKVMMEGFDEGWSNVIEADHVTYNLPSGDFVFKVLACNENDVWMTEPVEYAFTIRTPLWKMPVFYAGLVVLIGIGIFLGIRRREVMIKRENIKLERTVLERTKELRKEKNNVEMQNIEIVAQKREIEIKNNELEKKNAQIYDSINYAKRLQKTILTSEDILKKYFQNSFVFFKPKDMVSGDFYWIRDTSKYLYVAAVDCTGHGVPGALMSMVCTRLLEKAIDEAFFPDAGAMLSFLHDEMIKVLGMDANESYVRDGMDIALCIIEKGQNKINYAGAHNPFLMVRNGEAYRIDGDRKHIGFSYKKAEKRDFTSHEVKVQKNDMIYLFSDGYADQFGGEGEKKTKFFYQRFEDLLVSIADKPVAEQYNELVHTFLDWKKGYEQIDDVLVLGIKV